MAKFIKFLDRLINFYLYFVVMACFLSLVPYINPNYPLFKFIFTSAGFYLIPPILGISLSPTVVLIILVLCSIGIQKVYNKYFKQDESQIIVLTPEEFMNKIQQKKDEFIKSQEEEKRKENKDK